ncbi:hypothetical protein BJV74DRAFT_773849, partial [Russula compacta]
TITNYITWEWLPHKEMWSAISCQNHSIFEEGGTNMLLEYHHVPKSIWLEGKRNRRMDHLIYILVMEFLPHIETHHKWQTLGMEGPDLAKKCHQQILVCAPKTPLARI